MKRDTIFFDLDGTLLPVDMDAFMGRFLRMVMRLDFGQIPGCTVDEKMMQQGFAYLMSDQHPSLTNAEAFYRFMAENSGAPRDALENLFVSFYKASFWQLKDTSACEPLAAQTVALLKAKGYRLVLATNPVFPLIATQQRIEWAGLDPSDFAHITTIENANFIKPNLNYYRQILDQLRLSPEQCYMVGNSVEEDLCTTELGFEVFLLTDHLIGNIDEAPECEKGNYFDLKNWAERLPTV